MACRRLHYIVSFFTISSLTHLSCSTICVPRFCEYKPSHLASPFFLPVCPPRGNCGLILFCFSIDRRPASLLCRCSSSDFCFQLLNISLPRRPLSRLIDACLANDHPHLATPTACIQTTSTTPASPTTPTAPSPPYSTPIASPNPLHARTHTRTHTHTLSLSPRLIRTWGRPRSLTLRVLAHMGTRPHILDLRPT